MRELRARRRLVLTGTPLQNHISELWSILHFLDASKFDDLDDFLERYGALSAGNGTVGQVNRLNKLLRPHLLRREKADVEKSLLALQETLLFVEITNLQKLCYRACLEQNRELKDLEEAYPWLRIGRIDTCHRYLAVASMKSMRLAISDEIRSSHRCFSTARRRYTAAPVASSKLACAAKALNAADSLCTLSAGLRCSVTALSRVPAWGWLQP